ncbi:Uncharacterised protein [Halioglobus japonicus]|nr:Uncharacterised protein [Halioglobus japonicus]
MAQYGPITQSVIKNRSNFDDAVSVKVHANASMATCAREASHLLARASCTRSNKVERNYKEASVDAIGGDSEKNNARPRGQSIRLVIEIDHHLCRCLLQPLACAPVAQGEETINETDVPPI